MDEIYDRAWHILKSRPRPRFVEFGAYDGYHTDRFVNILHSLQRPFDYHVFEPKPKCIALTKVMLEKLTPMVNERGGTLLFVEKAVGQIDGPVPFWETEDNYPGSSSIRKPKLVFKDFPEMRFHETVVESIRFDTHIEQTGLKGEVIDFIWCDIQGAEIDLIKGGLDTFQNVRYFFTEYVNIEHYEGELSLAEFMKYLPDFEIAAEFPGQIWGDVLLRNKRLLHLDTAEG